MVLHCDQHLHWKRDKSLKSPEDIITVQKLLFYSMGPFERLLYFCMEGEPIPQVSDVIKDNIEKPLFIRWAYLLVKILKRAMRDC